MNPQDDSQNQGQEPQTSNSGMPQAPMNGDGNTQAPAPGQNTPTQGGGEGMPEMPKAPETPKAPEAGAGEAPVAPAPDEDDKADGSKW